MAVVDGEWVLDSKNETVTTDGNKNHIIRVTCTQEPSSPVPSEDDSKSPKDRKQSTTSITSEKVKSEKDSKSPVPTADSECKSPAPSPSPEPSQEKKEKKKFQS